MTFSSMPNARNLDVHSTSKDQRILLTKLSARNVAKTAVTLIRKLELRGLTAKNVWVVFI